MCSPPWFIDQDQQMLFRNSTNDLWLPEILWAPKTMQTWHNIHIIIIWKLQSHQIELDHPHHYFKRTVWSKGFRWKDYKEGWWLRWSLYSRKNKWPILRYKNRLLEAKFARRFHFIWLLLRTGMKDCPISVFIMIIS